MAVLARVIAATALHAVLAVSPARAAETSIAWRVENPFRFFTDPADTDIHRATFAALGPAEKDAPVLAAERALAMRHDEGWAAALIGRVCWDPAKNRYVCPGSIDYVHPKSHAVLAEVKGLEDPASLMCTWLTAPLAGAGGRGFAINARCNVVMRIEIPFPAGALVQVEVEGQRIAETRVRVTDLLIVGMGDSFGSGEGNPDVPVRFSRERSADYGKPSKDIDLVGYPARVGSWRQIGDADFINANPRWLDQACHRSLYSQQLRAALQIALEDPHRAVTYVGLACSGAEVTQGLFLTYKGNEWVPNPPALSQISAAAEAQCGRHVAREQDLPEAYHLNERIPELKGLVLRKCEPDVARRIDLVLLSVGGNDIGFARLVANAVLSDKSTLRRLGGWFGQVHDAADAETQLSRLEDRYKALNRALHNILHIPWGESDRIILSAYPRLALLKDGQSVCPDGQAGMTVLPDFRLSAEKARQGEQVGEELNKLMREQAQAHGWTFADAHRPQFAGRGICAGWLSSAFGLADDLRIPRKVGDQWEPFNPADWRPYAPRQRWFRTPNDSFMTGNFHVSESVLQKVLKLQTLSWFQLVLASTYSGAFHPTAEGHAAIADAMAERARGVLARYAREGVPR